MCTVRHEMRKLSAPGTTHDPGEGVSRLYTAAKMDLSIRKLPTVISPKHPPSQVIMN